MWLPAFARCVSCGCDRRGRFVGSGKDLLSWSLVGMGRVEGGGPAPGMDNGSGPDTQLQNWIGPEPYIPVLVRIQLHEAVHPVKRVAGGGVCQGGEGCDQVGCGQVGGPNCLTAKLPFPVAAALLDTWACLFTAVWITPVGSSGDACKGHPDPASPRCCPHHP